MGQFLQFLWDGTKLSYREGYSISMIKLLAIIGGSIISTVFLLHIIVKMIWKFKYNKIQRVVIQQQDDQETDIDSSVKKNKIKKPLLISVLELVLDIFFWIGILVISLIFSVYSGFDYISTVAACFIIIAIYSFALLFSMFRQIFEEDSINNKNYKVKQKDGLNDEFSLQVRLSMLLVRRKIQIMLISLILIFLAIFVPIALQKTCLCYNTNRYGVKFSEFTLSTQMTRSLWLPKQVCKDNSICHIYATLPSNSSSAVFINIHTGTNINELTAVFHDHIKSKKNQSHTANESNLSYQCEQIPFPTKIETRGQRNVFTCLITNLKANKLYDVQIWNFHKLIYQTKYKTLPSKKQVIKHKFTIVYGGDFGHFTSGLRLLRQIATQKPDVILIGGDVAYDNGILHCYYSWDLMLWAFEESMRPLKRLVPIIVAVGNHDVGFHSMAYVNITVSEQKGPLYFTYFPQEFRNNENQTGVLSVEHRKTFVHHFLGNFMLLSLDSGYLYDFGDPQTSWIQQTLQNYSYQNSTDGYQPIVQYHNPMFPSCYIDSIKNSPRTLKESHEIWLPLFDQFQVIGVFENHVHQFKRTYPIKNGVPNLISKEGIVFFGDGCMGVGGAKCSNKHMTNNTFNKGYFAAIDFGQTDHFWVMNQYRDTRIEFKAIDKNRKVVKNSFYEIKVSQIIDLIHAIDL